MLQKRGGDQNGAGANGGGWRRSKGESEDSVKRERWQLRHEATRQHWQSIYELENVSLGGLLVEGEPVVGVLSNQDEALGRV